jgi:pimeloyl-ACP methyl ester carboxylesterase
MAAQPVTRYATGGGAHIAYQILGHGPAMVIVPGFASHLEVKWEDGACRSFIRRLATFATVVRFDKRGTGLSDPVQELPTLEERDADLAAVIAEAGVDRSVLLGYSEGGPIAVRFAVTHPESVRGLILYGASAHGPPPWAMEQLRMAAAQPKRRRPMRQTTGWASLTAREQAVAALVTAGCSNPEIARRLFISRETVQTHLKHIFGKLGVDSRTALAALAADHFAARNP